VALSAAWPAAVRGASGVAGGPVRGVAGGPVRGMPRVGAKPVAAGPRLALQPGWTDTKERG